MQNSEISKDNNLSELEEKVTLSSLKPKKPSPEEINDANQGKIKMNNYTNMNNSAEQADLFTYYCALCGALVLITNKSLEKLPLRSTDNSIAINVKEIYVKLYLKKGGIVYIKRKNGIEPQFRWRCECGILICYQSTSYEEGEDLKSNPKPYIYVLNEALVLNMHSSRIIQELTDYIKIQKKT